MKEATGTRAVLLYALGAGAALNGAWMLLDAARWFGAVASDTGPLNLHLVRDVGAAYLTAGVALLAAARSPLHRGPLAGLAALFLALHALTHLVEVARGVTSLGHLAEDLPGVYAPALVLVWLAAASWRRPAEAL
jgi:hypothetical protein